MGEGNCNKRHDLLPVESLPQQLVVLNMVGTTDGAMHEFSPMVTYKLLNRPFDLAVLTAIFQHLRDHGSLLAWPGRPSTWGFAPRLAISKRMGYRGLSKSLSRKIRKSFLWLEEIGYLTHEDRNEPGMDPEKAWGATRFLLAYWVFRVVKAVGRVIGSPLRECSNAFKDLSRTPPEKTSSSLMERADRLGLSDHVLVVA